MDDPYSAAINLAPWYPWSYAAAAASKRSTPRNLSERYSPYSVKYCAVCGDRASGRHYGVISCEGCKSFFKRSIGKQQGFTCRREKDCKVTMHDRQRCKYCRFQKCLSAGMLIQSIGSEGLDNTVSLPDVNTSLVDQHKIEEDVYLCDDDSTSTVANDCHIEKEVLILEAFDTLAKSLNGKARPHHEEDILYDFDAPLLLIGNISFHLTIPSPIPVLLNARYIGESASRLLFLSVHWARSIGAFQHLSSNTQIELVQGSWMELFTLGMSQCSHILPLPAIFTAIITQFENSVVQDKVSPRRVKVVKEHFFQLQDYVKTLSKLLVDEREYAYLKAISLFSPDHAGSMGSLVKRFQDKAEKELRSYVTQRWGHNADDRFHRLLLHLPPLQSLQADVIEELFFAALIGTVHIESVIPLILRMNETEYNRQFDSKVV